MSAPRPSAPLTPGKLRAYRAACLLLIVLAWWIASVQVPRHLIPSPPATFQAALRLIADGKLHPALIDSLSVYAGGLTLAALTGIATGVIMGGYRPLGRTVDIFVYALAATPRVAFIPLIIVLLGLGVEAKTFIVFLGAVMPIIINTYTGVLNADDDLIEMARSTGASQSLIFRRIVLPGALPFLVTGLRLGATIGLINTVVAELYTAVTGLGGLLALYGNTFRMPEYFVIVIVLALIGGGVNEALRLLENRLTRWKPT